jgi:hypothetical protein
VRARARALAEPPRLEAAIAMLAELWDRRERDGLGAVEIDVCRAYALALLQRGYAADQERCAAVVQVGIEGARSRTERRFFERLAELAARLPRERPGA